MKTISASSGAPSSSRQPTAAAQTQTARAAARTIAELAARSRKIANRMPAALGAYARQRARRARSRRRCHRERAERDPDAPIPPQRARAANHSTKEISSSLQTQEQLRRAAPASSARRRAKSAPANREQRHEHVLGEVVVGDPCADGVNRYAIAERLAVRASRPISRAKSASGIAAPRPRSTCTTISVSARGKQRDERHQQHAAPTNRAPESAAAIRRSSTTNRAAGSRASADTSRDRRRNAARKAC